MEQFTKSIVTILLLTVFSCSEHTDSTSFEMVDEKSVASTDDKEVQGPERKLIKEGYVEFETGNLNSTRKNIFEAVDAYKGYVSSDREFKVPGRNSNTVIIRVPADKFDSLLKDATEGVEKFDSKEINVKDVTEEFLDIEARLQTKKELEIRYLDLLNEARNVSEILEIEKQLGQLRSEIESTEGRLKYLQNKVSYSTLTLTFYESIPDHTEFGEKFKNGFRNGWDHLIWFFVILINIWPFVLIGLGLTVAISVYRRRK